MAYANNLSSEKLEKSLLSAIIHNPGCLDKDVMSEVEAEESLIYEDVNKEIWRSILELREKDRGIDPTSVFEHVTSKNYLEKSQAENRLADIVRLHETEEHAEDWARTLAEKLERREMFNLGEALKSMAKTPDVSIEEIRDKARDELAESHQIDDAIYASEVAVSVIDRIESDSPGTLENKPIRFGMPELDRNLDEIEHDDYVAICGRPGRGKTALMIQLVCQQKIIYDNVVIDLFTLEMSAERLIHRLAAQLTGIPYEIIKRVARGREHKLSDGIPTDKMRNQISNGYKKIRGWRDNGGLRIYGGSYSGSEICQIIESNAAKANADDKKDYLCAYFDNFHRLSNQPTLEEKEAASSGFKDTALQIGHPVIGLFQLQRSQSNQNRPPKLTDIKGCGQVEQDVDRAIMIDRPDMRNDFLSEGELLELGIKPNWAKIDIRKNRESNVGYFEKFFHGPTMQFIDSEVQSEMLVSGDQDDKPSDDNPLNIFDN